MCLGDGRGSPDGLSPCSLLSLPPHLFCEPHLSLSLLPSVSTFHCTMGLPSAPPNDGGGTAKPSAKSSAAKSNAKSNPAKASTKARDKKGSGKAGSGGASPALPHYASPAMLLPALPLPILQLSLAAPSCLASPAASTCGAAALAALAAALVDTSGHLVAAGDVRRTLGAAVAEWVKALGGGGADDGGGGGVVDNVGRFVAAEIAALPADDEGADERAGVGGDVAGATALGALLGGKVDEFRKRRIVTACQAVGAATAKSVLRAGDEVVVWGVGAQPEVLAALERYVSHLVKNWETWMRSWTLLAGCGCEFCNAICFFSIVCQVSCGHGRPVHCGVFLGGFLGRPVLCSSLG